MPLSLYAEKEDSYGRAVSYTHLDVYKRQTFNGRILLKAFTNGSSEMVTNLSLSIVGVLYNFQLMRLAGEDGVAAYGIIMYVNFIFMAIFFGYSIGTGPIVAYQYGAGNHLSLIHIL